MAEPASTPPDATFGAAAPLDVVGCASLFEHVPFGVFLSDAGRAELPVVYCNPALEATTGCTRAEVVERPCLSWQAGDGAVPTHDEIRRAALGEGDRRFTLRYVRDGTPCWHELTVSPIFDGDGRLTHVLGVETDVTKRREAELQVRERSHSLRASQRTLEEQSRVLRETNQKLRENQAQLVHSEKMASLGQLAAGVAHEINNPIGFIHSNLGTLGEYADVFRRLFEAYAALEAAVHAGDAAARDDALDRVAAIRREEDLDFVLADVGQLTEESRSGVERVTEIVQSLKSFARLDEAEAKHADVNEGLRTTLRMLWNQLKYKAAVHEHLQPLPSIRCFPGQLNQVFMNLLQNAAQAIEEHGEITVETEAADDAVVVRISDTGVGIPEENVARLFNPFFTTKPVGQGTGLGLAISYGIVKKHGGEIEVESTVGHGTTFTVRLPMRAAGSIRTAP